MDGKHFLEKHFQLLKDGIDNDMRKAEMTLSESLRNGNITFTAATVDKVKARTSDSFNEFAALVAIYNPSKLSGRSAASTQTFALQSNLDYEVSGPSYVPMREPWSTRSLRAAQITSHMAAPIHADENEDDDDEDDMDVGIKRTLVKRNTGLATSQTEKSLVAERSRKDKIDGLLKHGFGTIKFTNLFSKLESTAFNGKTIQVICCENGDEFEAKVLKDCLFENVYWIKEKVGLGMKVDETLDFKNAAEVFGEANDIKVSVIDSRTNIPMWKELGFFPKFFKKTKQQRKNAAYNLLAFEFSQVKGHTEKYEIPSFVVRNSMVHELKEKIENILDQISKKANEGGNSSESGINYTEEEVKNAQRKIPELTKYLILSTAGSMTSVHIDFSGTSVFYHVIKGRKIFYLVKKTEENMKKFQKNEKRANTLEPWVGMELFGEYSRIEIQEGNTVIIPGGFIHFVYTPVDSIVFAGNFFVRSQLDIQFKISEIEFIGGHKKSEIVSEFYPLMTSYVRFVFLEVLRDDPSEKNIKDAETFYLELKKRIVVENDRTWEQGSNTEDEELKKQKKESENWIEETEKVLDTLHDIMKKIKQANSQKRAFSSNNVQEPAAKKGRGGDDDEDLENDSF